MITIVADSASGANAEDPLKEDRERQKAIHEWRLHSAQGQTIQQKALSLAETDAKSLAITLKQEGKAEPEAVMDSVSYWQYVKKADRPYYDEVVRRVKKELPVIMNSIPLVPAAPATGAPPGGPPALGSSKKAVKTGLFLTRREKKPYKMMGSLPSDIVSGEPYLDGDGEPVFLQVRGAEELAVPTHSVTAREAARMQEELPPRMRALLREYAEKHGARNPAEISKCAYSRIRTRSRKSKYDLLPMSLITMKATDAMAMLAGCDGAKEPEGIGALRKALGREMSFYAGRLADAMAVDGIEASARRPKKDGGGAPARRGAPRVLLHPEDIATSVDVRSLVMTMIMRESREALMRLMTVFARHPALFREDRLEPSDIAAMKSLAPDLAGEFERLHALDGADEADIAQAYTAAGSDFFRSKVAEMVASRGRHEIVSAFPEMCVIGGRVNADLFAELDAKDSDARRVIRDVARRGLECPGALLGRKLIEALRADPASASGGAGAHNEPAALYALALGAETGDEAAVSAALADASRSGRGDFPDLRAIAAYAVAKHSRQLSKGVFKTLKPDPRALRELYGEHVALFYMKARRVDWDGRGIPEASEIASAPDNPLPLARSLADIRDEAGLLALLYRMAESVKGRVSKTDLITMAFIRRNLGEHAAKGDAILSQFGMGVADSGEVSLGANPVRAIFTQAADGQIVWAAMALCKLFEEDEERARMVLENMPRPPEARLFLEMLPQRLLSSCVMPDWARALSVQAAVMPDGVLATGRFGLYEAGGRVFASADVLAADAYLQGLARRG